LAQHPGERDLRRLGAMGRRYPLEAIPVEQILFDRRISHDWEVHDRFDA
jgi:hypothetical protein